MHMNPIIGTDSYKVTHAPQYPPKTRGVSAYLEARGLSKEARLMGFANTIVAFGALRPLLHDIFGTPVTHEHIEEAREFFAAHFGNDKLFNITGWRRIVNQHGGWLPLHVRAVPEGLHVPLSNILMRVDTTDEELPWLANYVETRLSHAWYPYTVATLSWNCKQTILKYLKATGSPETIDFKLHDFGFRGVNSDEGAIIGGAAHLVNFQGSDTLPAIKMLRHFYGCHMAGFSIPAAEHSTITSWGEAFEVDAYRNMLQQYPEGLVAVVSDSYDIYQACDTLWGTILRDEVMKRQGTLVIRPDSGDPVEVVLRVVSILYEKFGGTVNNKGFKVLDPHVRVIQGDGVDPMSIGDVLRNLAQHGFSADNVGFGMGGALVQKVNRDTFKFAFKASAINIDGAWHDVWKHPIDAGDKVSKRGRLTLYLDERRSSPTYNTFVTASSELDNAKKPGTDMMQTMYFCGAVGSRHASFLGGIDTFEDIRARANAEPRPSPRLMEYYNDDDEVDQHHVMHPAGYGAGV
jgi:nicotinamide phosphoribosyltransferase